MAEKSCGFAIGNLRARENRLLRQTDYQQLCAAPDLQALAALLRDKGFGSRTENGTVEQLSAADRKQLWDYLAEISPDSRLFDGFLVVHDFHNCKAILKATLRGLDAADYLLHPETVSVDLLQTAVREKNWRLLPEWLAPAAEAAYDALVTKGDGQLCDVLLDTACMQTRLALCRKKGTEPLLREITEAAVCGENIKTALRCAETGKNAAFTDAALTDTPPFSKSALKAAALSGTDAVLELLCRKGTAWQAAAEAYKAAPTDFERFCEDAVMEIARKAKKITLGAEPIIGYYIARITEQKNIRIIESGVAVGQKAEIIQGKLRALYG